MLSFALHNGENKLLEHTAHGISIFIKNVLRAPKIKIRASLFQSA